MPKWFALLIYLFFWLESETVYSMRCASHTKLEDDSWVWRIARFNAFAF